MITSGNIIDLFLWTPFVQLFKELIISCGLFDKIKCLKIILANIQVVPIKSCRELYEYSYHQYFWIFYWLECIFFRKRDTQD